MIPNVQASQTRLSTETTLRQAKTKDAAEQFEAVLIAQLLRSMRESASAGWLGTGDDAAGGSMMEIAEEHLAGVMAKQGGIGLATLVSQGLSDANGSGPR